MAYQALYRRFRPRRFDDVKGQETVGTILKHQIVTGQTAHAYLFTGPRGTGKTSMARIFAAALFCEHLEDGEPCQNCENCREAQSDTMADLVEIDAASNNGVDAARDLREKVSLLPLGGKHKVYIIDEVHMLSTAAFNALLKTLEEPPPYAVFILATTEFRKIPATVVSRCQVFNFRRLDDATIERRLLEVAKEMHIVAQPEALSEIARAASGGMRDAMTIFEKCCSFGDAVDLRRVEEVLGLADAREVETLFSAMLAFDEPETLSRLSRILDEGGISAMQLAAQLLQKLRDTLYNSVKNGEQIRRILRLIDILEDAESRMRLAVRPRLLLEAAVFRILLPEEQNDLSGVYARLAKLEAKAARAPIAAAPEYPIKAQIKQELSEQAPVAAGTQSEAPEEKGDPQALWEALREIVSKEDKPFAPMLTDCYITRVQGNRVTIGSLNASRLRILGAGSGFKELLAKYAQMVTGKQMIVEIESAQSGDPKIPEGLEIED